MKFVYKHWGHLPSFFLFLINTFVCDKYELHLYLIEFPLVILLLHAFHGHSVDKVNQRHRACFKDFTFMVIYIMSGSLKCNENKCECVCVMKRFMQYPCTCGCSFHKLDHDSLTGNNVWILINIRESIPQYW